MVVIYSYLEKDNDEVLKFHLNNSSFFETSTTSYKLHPPINAVPLLSSLLLSLLLLVLLYPVLIQSSDKSLT